MQGSFFSLSWSESMPSLIIESNVRRTSCKDSFFFSTNATRNQTGEISLSLPLSALLSLPLPKDAKEQTVPVETQKAIG